MADVAFVALTIACFAVVALVARAVGRLVAPAPAPRESAEQTRGVEVAP